MRSAIWSRDALDFSCCSPAGSVCEVFHSWPHKLQRGSLAVWKIAKPTSGGDKRLGSAKLKREVEELTARLQEKAEAGGGIQAKFLNLATAIDALTSATKGRLGGHASKRKGSPYRSGRSPDWLKMKNPNAPAVKREAEEEWGKKRWRG